MWAQQGAGRRPGLGVPPAKADTGGAASADTGKAARSGPLLLVPPPGGLPDSARSYIVVEWDRDALVRAPALDLLDLLERALPGLTPIRAGYFGGPQYALAGGANPGRIVLVRDGVEIPPLQASQVDLSRIAVVDLDRVRVIRRPGSLVVELTTLRRRTPEAYSRVSAGSGIPGINLVRGVLVNGLGRHLDVGAGFDLLNTSGFGTPANRTHFWGRLGWAPDPRAGVELQWRSESGSRSAVDTVDFSVRAISAAARWRAAPAILAELVGSRRSWNQTASEGDTTLVASEVGLRLTAGDGRRYLRVGAFRPHGPGQATARGEVDAGLDLPAGLGLDASAGLRRFADFRAWRAGAGLVFRPGRALLLAVQGATGIDGTPRPLESRADSLHFDEASGRAELHLGPFDLRGRGVYQKLSRQLPFDAAFDRGLEPLGALEVATFEGSAEGPVLPLGWLLHGLAPLRFDGSWAHHRILSDGPAIYLPVDEARGELRLEDRFFQGNLEVETALGLVYRSQMLSYGPGSTDLAAVPSFSRADWRLRLKLAGVTIFWRVDGMNSVDVEDVPGLPHPPRVNVYGVKWEFTN